MLEGLLRHFTSADIDRNYVDTHGASVVGFAFCQLLGFKLMPRLKNIGAARLYGPGGADDQPWMRSQLSQFPEQRGSERFCLTGRRRQLCRCCAWSAGHTRQTLP